MLCSEYSRSGDVDPVSVPRTSIELATLTVCPPGEAVYVAVVVPSINKRQSASSAGSPPSISRSRVSVPPPRDPLNKNVTSGPFTGTVDPSAVNVATLIPLSFSQLGYCVIFEPSLNFC